MLFLGWTHVVIIVLWYLTCPMKSEGNTCTDIEYFPNLHTGLVKNSEFLDIANSTVLGCVKQCQLRRRCTSFNFNITSGTCYLNENSPTVVSGQVHTAPNSVYSDIRTWPSRLAGACSSHTCPENAECRETTSGGFECQVTSCVDPPGVYSGELNLTSRFVNFYDTVPFTCIDGHAPRGRTTCLPDGSWEVRSECLPLRSCSNVKACNPSYTDGEYLIHHHQDPSLLMKVYCHDMASGPAEFISVGDTYSIFADRTTNDLCWPPWQYDQCGRTDFEKVRLNHWNLVAYRYDHTFARSHCSKSAPLGYAGDCRECHLSQGASGEGSFRINTTGTGFRVASNVQWTSDEGKVNIHRSSNGLVIQGVCEGGCALCKHTGAGVYDYGFQLELDPSYDPRLSTATYPVCN